jgi:hypothetical protein
VNKDVVAHLLGLAGPRLPGVNPEEPGPEPRQRHQDGLAEMLLGDLVLAHADALYPTQHP